MNSRNHRNRFEFEHLAKSRRNFDKYLENFKILTSKVSEICDELNLSKPDLNLNESLESLIDERNDDEIAEDLVQFDELSKMSSLFTSAEDLKDSESKNVKVITSKVSEIRDRLNLIKQDLDLNESLASELDEGKGDDILGDLVQHERASRISSPLTSAEDTDDLEDGSESKRSESVLSDGSCSKSRNYSEQPQQPETYPSNIVYFKVDIHHLKRESQQFKVAQKDSFFKPEAVGSSEASHGVSDELINELVPNVGNRPIIKAVDKKVHFGASKDSFATAPNCSSRMTSEEELMNSRLESFLSGKNRPRISAKRPSKRESFPSNVIYLSFDVQPKPKKKETSAFDVVQKGNFFELVNRPKLLSGTKSTGRRKDIWY